MKKTIPLLFVLLFSIPSAKLFAEEFYAGFDASAGVVRIKDAKFNPINAELSVGYYFQKQIGVELNVLRSLTDDDDLSLKSEVTQHAGITFRFESPERNQNKIMILLGYSYSKIDLSLNESDFPGEESFDGLSFGLAAEHRMFKDQNWFVGLKAMRYLDKDDVSFDTMGLGVRYAF